MIGVVVVGLFLVPLLAIFLAYLNIQFFSSSPFSGDEIVEGLWLGSFDDLVQSSELKNRNVTHVLSVAPGIMPYKDYDHLFLRGMDVDTTEIIHTFEEAHAFIEAALDADGVVFVHCMQGVSRSGTIVASYVMKTHGMTAEEAIRFVNSKRDIVNPNIGFKRQLLQYERLLNGDKEVQENLKDLFPCKKVKKSGRILDMLAGNPMITTVHRSDRGSKKVYEIKTVCENSTLSTKIGHSLLHNILYCYNYYFRRFHRFLVDLKHSL